MNLPLRNRRGLHNVAFTAWDLLIVLAAVTCAVVWFCMWPRLTCRRPGSNSYKCVTSLRQLGLGCRIWASDHNDKFPWQASTNEGGLLELSGALPAFRYFEVMSNELSSPKVLVCPMDQRRTKAAVWGSSMKSIGFTGDSNLSYFVGLNATEGQPGTILSGDRSISTNALTTSGFLTLSSNSPVRWGKGLHETGGYLGLADGSVQQLSDAGLTNLLREQTKWPVRLVIP